jgi:cation:H+ antiporter
MLNFALLFLALFLLWFGADMITKAAIKIAKALALSEGFVGLTILAIGTGFPEIIISVTGAVQNLQGANNNAIIIGNIIGSCMSNLALILGLSGLLRVIRLKKNAVFFDAVILILSTSVFYLTARDGFISREDGLVFVLFYVVYLIFLNRRNLNSQLKQVKSKAKRKINKITKRKKVKFIFFLQLIFGLAILAKSSEMVLDYGSIIAAQMGINEMLVGILLIGLGSSLPELAVSINAASKGSVSLSLNNLIGSNILDIFLALGVSSSIHGWEVSRNVVQFDLPYLLFTTIVAVLFLFSRNKLQRNESILMISLYLIYVILKAMGF